MVSTPCWDDGQEEATGLRQTPGTTGGLALQRVVAPLLQLLAPSRHACNPLPPLQQVWCWELLRTEPRLCACHRAISMSSLGDLVQNVPVYHPDHNNPQARSLSCGPGADRFPGGSFTFMKPHGNSQEYFFYEYLFSWPEKEVSSVEAPLQLTASERPGGVCAGTTSRVTPSHCTASLRKSPITPQLQPGRQACLPTAILAGRLHATGALSKHKVRVN